MTKKEELKLYKCNGCDVWSPYWKWYGADTPEIEAHYWNTPEYEAYCEECGSHSAWKCPECDDIIDSGYYDIEEVCESRFP